MPKRCGATCARCASACARELGTRGAGFDLKQDPGGIVDIEFMVQYGVLLWSHHHPALLTYTDNVRLLDGFAQAGLMSTADSRALAEVYRAFRAQVHRLTLQEEPAVVEAGAFAGERALVEQIWQQWLEEAPGPAD